MAGSQPRTPIAVPCRLLAGMALDRQIVRLAKILVDNEGVSFDEAQRRLRALTLEIVIAPDAASPAAHAAVLTAVSVGRRTFLGGIRVVGTLDQPLYSALPISAGSLGEAAVQIGASTFEGKPSRRIVVGKTNPRDDTWSIAALGDGWRAGTAEIGATGWDEGDNPLSGIAAGALAVGKAFEAERGCHPELRTEIDLWPVARPDQKLPRFTDVFLPGALWLIGLGNLGQAFLWALAALPYADPSAVSLVLQDRDKVTEENWATSVLVHDQTYGSLKTRVCEGWAAAKGFDVRRLDRCLLAGDRLEDDDPRVALSGVDKIESRKLMEAVGFHCIVDAGLGRTPADFDRYRVTVFDHTRPIHKHFAGQTDKPMNDAILDDAAYQRLEAELGRRGAAEVAGASVAVPYVSAIASVVAVSRLIAVSSGCECPPNEVGRISNLNARRLAPAAKIKARGVRHAGRPKLESC
jgi:hypothetical protein